ncbi:MAG: transporter related protein [Solirubrobacterales bacterium]|nr:transporter related protein [Solirubrobacterales bacterium]
MTALLQADSLYRFYHAGDDETLALQGVSFAVQAGELVAVTGPSGSGKSTLLGCLAGLDEPTAGMVQVDGQRLSRRPEAERAAIRATTIGMLFQSANLVEHLTVAENVELAQRIAGRPDRARAAKVLADVGLQARTHARPSQLSGGELARAGLAVALANDPRVVLADEPTGELDGVTAHGVLNLLRARAQDGAAVVVVTHNPAVADVADRTIALADGRIADPAARAAPSAPDARPHAEVTP